MTGGRATPEKDDKPGRETERQPAGHENGLSRQGAEDDIVESKNIHVSCVPSERLKPGDAPRAVGPPYPAEFAP
jgi:hypothetical protein